MIGALLVAAASLTAPVAVGPAAGPWAAAPVPGWLEREVTAGMRRVRLIDDRGREVPYRLVDEATDLPSPWTETAIRNLRRTQDGFAFELELPPEPIDALEIELGGDGGVLAVEVTAGEPPGTLVRGARVGRLQGVAVGRVELPVTDAGRLGVQLTALVPGLEPRRVRVHRTLRPARERTSDVPYRAARIPGDGDRDRWRLAATGAVERVDALTLEIAAPAVLRRTVTVVAAGDGDGDRRRVLGRGEIARLPLADGSRGIADLRIALSPGAWPALEVEIEHGGEAPAELVGASGTAARRWIVFPRPEPGRSLRLIAGDAARSDTLERGPLPVHPDDATEATVGPPDESTTPAPAPSAAGPSAAVSLLFVAAAALLAVLAWRVLR